ncbi:translational GTPase TypA, partial [Vibrio diabolicus]
LMEPFETVTIDVMEEHQGGIMENIGLRKGELKDMAPDGKGRVRMDFIMPSRGLIGFQTEFMTLTSGSGLLYHTFDHYGPHKGGNIGQRNNGVLIANAAGKALT